MVTSRDVARAAGVSQATVSRAMQPDSSVRPATRQRVLNAMAQVGYVPNLAARTMKTGRTGTVGVVVADLTNPFYPRVLEALSEAFDASGYRITVWIADTVKNTAALQAIRAGAIDGVVFTTVTESSAELRDTLGEHRPLVLMNRTLPGVECDQVGTDNAGGAALVADHLVHSGSTRIAFVGGTPGATTSSARLRGFDRRLAELGHPLDPARTVHGEYSHDSGYAAMHRLLDADSSIDAVFCSNDVLALGAIDAVRARGLTVGVDVLVAGYDDIEMAAWESFSLSTVRQDPERMSRDAARMLLQRIDDPVRPFERVELEPVLIVRRSTRG